MIEETRTKRCSKCSEEKPLSEFYKNKSTKDGLAFFCKKCQKYYTRNIDKEKELKYLLRENFLFNIEYMMQKDLTNIFGVSRVTISEWSDNKGCPRNQDGSYNLKNVIEWWKKYQKDKFYGRRYCNSCNLTKKKEEFYYSKSRNFYQGYCKECSKLNARSLPDSTIRARIKIKYKIPYKLIDLDTIQRERELILLNRKIRKEFKNGRSKKINS